MTWDIMQLWQDEKRLGMFAFQFKKNLIILEPGSEFLCGFKFQRTVSC